MSVLPWLSLLIWLPIISGFCLLLVNNQAARWVGLGLALLCFGLSLGAWYQFDAQLMGYQFIEHKVWFSQLAMNYSLGVDGFAMPLILLTCLFTPIVILSAWNLTQQPNRYFSAFLILQGLMCGVFATMDAMLFYVFWEAMLIPMFLIIGVWGGQNRIYATIKFFLYTFFGSIFLLVALIYLHLTANQLGFPDTFAISTFQQLPLKLVTQEWILAAFLLAFAVKIPMFPVHTWLPDAHVEAPTGGSVVLAAIMLKMGAYGFLRFILPIVPDATRHWQAALIAASLIAVIYIGLTAIVQKDMKKLIAYSSIAHMGFVTLGIVMSIVLMNDGLVDTALLSIQGAYVQMISHGFISGALFLCIGMLYERLHSRQIKDYGGVANTMPILASLMVFFAFANAGLPGTSGFVGEFLVILAAFQVKPMIALLAATTLILGATYTLWMVKRVIFGQAKGQVLTLVDLSRREISLLGLLAVLVLSFGLWPAPLLKITEPATKQLLMQVGQPKYE